MSKETPLYVVDANVLLRFITKTPPDQAAKARDLLKRGQAGEVRLVLEPLTLADVVYVLKKPYAMSYVDIESVLLKLFASGAVEVLERERCEIALALVVRHKVDFEDAYLAGIALELGGGVASFDRHLKRLGVDWLEP
ncbi:MAG: twitching motility protein PilT [Meiothermus sp.]